MDTSLVFNIFAKDQTGKGFDRVKTSAKAAGVAVGAALAVGLAGAFSTEDAMAKFKAQVGDAPWAAKAGAAAGNLYKNAYGESMAEVAEATRQVMSSGLLRGDAAQADIEGLTGKAMSLAQAFDQEVGPMAAAAAQMIKTGLAKNGEEALDILTKGFQNGTNKADDLLDTFNEYGTQFRKLGIDGKTAMGLLGQGIRGGARDADIVADAFKEFSIRAVEGSDASREAYKALGLNAKEMERQIAKGGDSARTATETVIEKFKQMTPGIEKNTHLFGLFGTQSEDLGAAFDKLDVSTAAESLGKVTGAAGKVDAALGATASATVTAFKRQMEDGLIDVMARAIKFIKPVTDAIVRHKDVIVPAVAALAGFAAAVYIGIGAMKAYRAALAAAAVAGRIYRIVATNMRFAQILLNAAFLSNPLGLVVLACIALGAAFVVLWKKSETFRSIVKGAFDVVKEAGLAVGRAIKKVAGWFVDAWDKMRFGAGKAIQLIGGMYITFADGVLGVFEGLLRGAAKLPRWLGGGKFDAAADAVAGIRNGLDTLRRKLDEIPTEKTLTFRSNANEVIGSLAALKRAQDAVGTTGGGVTVSSGGGAQQGRYGGMRAAGGPVRKGTTYLVGEKGPELFTASAAGRIVPNHVISAAGEGGRQQSGMRQYGRWTMDGFALGVKDRQKSVDAAMTKLTDLVRARIEKLQAAVNRSKEIASGIRESFASFGNVTSLETGGTFLTGLRAMTDKATAFAKGVTELRKKGLDKRALEQIIAAGPEGGLATVEQLINSGGIGAVNAAMDKIAAAGAGLGRREALAQTGWDPRTNARALVKVGKERQKLDLTLSGDGNDLVEAIVKSLRKKVRASGGNVQVVLGTR